MRVLNLQSFLDSLVQRIRERMGAIFDSNDSYEVFLEGELLVNTQRKLFASANSLDECVSHILHNLQSKAFCESGNTIWIGCGKPAVRVEVTESLSNEVDPSVTIRVYNNGTPLQGSPPLGAGGKRAAKHLAAFGGVYERPVVVNDHGWQVSQRITIVVW